MKPIVKSKLDGVFNYPFFDSVGKPLPSGVSRVNTWSQAAKTCGFVKWGNNQLMASNALRNAIQIQYPKQGMWERMQEWNPLCEELSPLILSFVDTLLLKVPLEAKELKKIKDNVSWDILGICLETHYADIAEPIFSIPYLDCWYAAGHFPCGWDGDEFPENWDGILRGGQLIVF